MQFPLLPDRRYSSTAGSVPGVIGGKGRPEMSDSESADPHVNAQIRLRTLSLSRSPKLATLTTVLPLMSVIWSSQ